MGMRKTAEVVTSEIAALKELLPLLPKSRRAIQAQIDVLADEMSSDDLYDRFEGSHEFDDANAVYMWRCGHNSDEAMSVQWKELL
jgi:hypothetical protein